MFGPFKASSVALGGLLWKSTWRLSNNQKYRLRKRMQVVDKNIEILFQGLQDSGKSAKVIDYLKNDFPKEAEMEPRDKYTTYSKTSKGYRKSVHKVPKWTKISFRENPKHF